MKPRLFITAGVASLALLAGCQDEKEAPKDDNPPAPVTEPGEEEEEHDDEHEHEETPLGTFDVGGLMIEAAQSHGNVEPGKESHLAVKLPYKDDGATVVRAWLGTEDRTLSTVGKGDYAASHDGYDIHAVAPDPLPEGTKWWLEIEKPDGTKSVGSFPILKDIKKD